ARLSDDGAGDDRSLSLGVFLEDARALALAGALDDDLLGGLGGDAAQSLHVDRPAVDGGGDAAGQGVELDGGLFGLERLADRAGHRAFEVGDELLAVDVLVAADAVDDADEVLVHGESRYLVFQPYSV